MRVVVVGGGIGGLVAALAFAARGGRPVLLEREAAFAEAGAGVQLGPNAVRVLDDLGLGAALRAVSCAPDAADVFSGVDGSRRLRVPLGAAAQARWGAPYLQLHRADLQRLLLDAIAARDAADVRLGCPVAHVDDGGDLRLASGEAVAADVVIGADGLRSRVRAAVAGEAPPRFTGQTAWRALVPAASLPAEAVPTGASVWAGRGRHVVAYRVNGGRAVNLVAIVQARGWRGDGWREAGDPRALASLFAGWPLPVATLCAAPAELGLPTWRWALFDRPPTRVWRRGRAVLLGDAAHAMLPFLAQGAAMAIEDAAVLAARSSAFGDPDAAIDAYVAARTPRVARVQAWSTRNARLFHLPEPAAKLVFAAARTLDERDPTGGMSRFDWLYGWRDEFHLPSPERVGAAPGTGVGG